MYVLPPKVMNKVRNSLTSRFSGLHASLSPNAAALLVLDEQHVPTLNVIQYSKLINPDTMSDSQSSL